MEYTVPLIAFFLGAIIGSFINALLYRFKTGISIYTRSMCMSCATVIAWYDLIPVMSYFILQGRCRACDSRISGQYPTVEILTGVLYTLLAYTYGVSVQSVLLAVLMSIMVFIFVYDYKHKIIPNEFVYPLILISFALLFIDGNKFSADFFNIHNIYVGLSFFLFFFLFWFLSKGAWMGLGDAKLAVAIGLLLGSTEGISAIVLGFWLGAAVGLLLMLYSRIINTGFGGMGMKTELPFAPFLIIGAWVVFFSHFNLFNVLV